MAIHQAVSIRHRTLRVSAIPSDEISILSEIARKFLIRWYLYNPKVQRVEFTIYLHSSQAVFEKRD